VIAGERAQAASDDTRDVGPVQAADIEAYAKTCVNWISAGGQSVERGAKGLFDLYAARIKSRFRRKGLSDEDAADVLQETFVKAVRAAASFRGDAKVSTWLWSIADNALIDWLRKERRAPKGTDTGSDEDQEGEYDARFGRDEPGDEVRAMQDCVARAFEQFTRGYPELSDAIELGIVERWSMRDLAAFLGRTEGATKEFVSQCRKRLRPFLEPCLEYLRP